MQHRHLPYKSQFFIFLFGNVLFSFQNLESSINDDSCRQSLSSIEENPENTLAFWKEKCYHLELQLQDIESNQPSPPLNDIEVQCSFDDQETERLREEMSSLEEQNTSLRNEIAELKDQNEQSKSETQTLEENFEQMKIERDRLKEENEQVRNEINVLKEDMSNLNFQLSSISMQRSTSSDVNETFTPSTPLLLFFPFRKSKNSKMRSHSIKQPFKKNKHYTIDYNSNMISKQFVCNYW